MSTVEDLARLYDRRAQIPFDGSTYFDRVSADIDALAGLKCDDRLVDIGCGRGWHLQELVRRGHRNLWGIDASAGSLANAAVLLKGELGTSVHLVHGDVATWGVTAFFDVASCFLMCLGAISASADRVFAATVRRMLRSDARLVATLFDSARANDLVGRFCVSYAEDNDEKLVSEVRYDSEDHCLHIEQSHPRLPEGLVEKLHLYSRDDVNRLLGEAGFRRIEFDVPPGEGANGLMLVMASAGG